MREEKTETFSEEVSRLRREIAERQARLSLLILGDQSKGVSITAFAGLPYRQQPK